MKFFSIYCILIFFHIGAQPALTSLSSVTGEARQRRQAEEPNICTSCDAPTPHDLSCCDGCVQSGTNTSVNGVQCLNCSPLPYTSNFSCTCYSTCTRTYIVTVNRFTDQYGDHYYSLNRYANYGTSYIFENVLALGSSKSGSGLVALLEYYTYLPNGATRHFYTVNPADVPTAPNYAFSKTVCYIYTEGAPNRLLPIYRFYNANDIVALLTRNETEIGTSGYWTPMGMPGYMPTINVGLLS